MRHIVLALQAFSTVCLITLIVAFYGCGGDGGGDESPAQAVPTPTPAPQISTITDDDSCPITIAAETAGEARATLEGETGGESTDVEDLGELDQGSALRLFRVWLKDIQINIHGCDNGVTVNQNSGNSSSTATTLPPA